MFPTKPLPPDAGLWKCRDLDGLWLFCFCGNRKCGHNASHLLADMIKRRPMIGLLELGRVMLKLRCRRCGEEPARVVLLRSSPGEPPRTARTSRDQIELMA